ncbi:hypothetical protein K470DRAFT_254395 [Piedraia hortae CBS 480.64]|uniref:U-box domain-containing protein n=1 Tax=Piedraia hortae CBS 480.64 TaxID=1314780 RepID=A0A6A7CAN6_9PEZI|nr:hypothetical protein K470DRAFT_254395 [Piedraia hortae CBS 480.64]
MGDTPMSDANKIRAKRLAKLAANSANNPNSAQNDTSDQTGDSSSNPFADLGLTKANSPPRAASPAKRDSSGAELPRPSSKEKLQQKPSKDVRVPARRPSAPRPKKEETMEGWQDKNLRAIFRVTLDEGTKTDVHGAPLIYLSSLHAELREAGHPLQLNSESLETIITEAGSKAHKGKAFEYLLQCFKRAVRQARNARYNKVDESRLAVLKEAQRMSMSYTIFALTMPDMFGEGPAQGNPLVDHLLVADSEGEVGICSDFLDEAVARMEEDDSVKELLVGAAEELSVRLRTQNMLRQYQPHVHGLRNLIRKKPIAEAITHSQMWAPSLSNPAQIETETLLGPFFRLSPLEPSVAQTFFSAPKTRDQKFIQNAQNSIRLELRNHQHQLFQIADTFVRAGAGPKEKMLSWFALCVNKNHKRRAMQVDYKAVSSDGFMLNVTTTLDRLCEPFMDASFAKIDRIDVDYFRRNPRVDISDETKINADQKTSDEFYSQQATGSHGFISECFFLAVAAHHYGTESTQEHMSKLKKTVKHYEKEVRSMESDKSRLPPNDWQVARLEEVLKRYRTAIDDCWSSIYAMQGPLMDDLTQSRSMQFMRYVIVWLLRLISHQNIPSEQIQLPLPSEQPDKFRCLPEYFLEDIVENFKFITMNMPWIMTVPQSEEIVQICVALLRSSEYVKNMGIKSGLSSILFYGCQSFGNYPNGLLGDILIGSAFAHKHLLHALMRFYIEAEHMGTHTQFYDKFNIRFEIFQVIKCIWKNGLYRENLAKEAKVNTDFFVQFVNMIVNDVTFVLDESLTSFTKIHELTTEIRDPAFQTLDEEQRKSKEELLEDQKSKAKSYMGLTRESMETLILFTETLPDAFTMPEIVQRLADMLDYNLDIMVGSRRTSLIVENPSEYNWNPKALLSDIIRVFLNLSSKERFIQAVARDGRSYKPSSFQEAANLMRNKMGCSEEVLVAWNSLGEQVAAAKEAEEAEEADLGEIPDEFTDPLLATCMTDPVILPASRAVIDRSTIRSHLLSDPHDPFNRMPLKLEDVIPNDELKARIQQWKTERLAEKRGSAV